jgi:hypothetical protein
MCTAEIRMNSAPIADFSLDEIFCHRDSLAMSRFESRARRGLADASRREDRRDRIETHFARRSAREASILSPENHHVMQEE